MNGIVDGVLRYAAFTDRANGGNPAGVSLLGVMPPETEMQRVAEEVGYSETAFVVPSEGGDYDIRYFSPDREISFCGHATIAAGVALSDDNPHLARVVFRTRTDAVPVSLRRQGRTTQATLTSPPTTHASVAGRALDATLAAFGWSKRVLDPGLPPAVASAGANHLIVPLADREDLAAMDYDFEALRTLMLHHGWTTVALMWQETIDRYHARNAFAVGGVIEDPATGAAAAAFGGLLRALGMAPVSRRFTIVQGVDMGRPSLLEVTLPTRSDRVEVTGGAVLTSC